MAEPLSDLGQQEWSPAGPSRRPRTSIAAQACNTCRLRKARCDEARPACGRCARLGTGCQYNEPMVQRKDEPFSRIYASLDRIENKLEHISDVPSDRVTSVSQAGNPPTTSSLANLSPLQRYLPVTLEGMDGESPPKSAASTQAVYPPEDLKRSYYHLCTAHRICLWPAVYTLIAAKRPDVMGDIDYIFRQGTPWFNHFELLTAPAQLPSKPRLLASSPDGAGAIPSSSISHLPGFSLEHVHRLTRAYFCTFNILYPILCAQTFDSEILGPFLQGTYQDDDIKACIALLVLALGQVAIDAQYGEPIRTINGQGSGIRGGTSETPPGLALFNEARRMIGLFMHQISLENVQVYILMATYQGSCARYLDFYRSAVAASVACQALLRCGMVNWSSLHGDLVKRAYWTCVLNENLYCMESDLPGTQIESLEDIVPLPFNNSDYDTSSGIEADNATHFRYHFLAMIVLRRLIMRVHNCLHGSGEVTNSEEVEHYGGPPTRVIQELNHQLQGWRSALPEAIQWLDEDMSMFRDSSVAHPSEVGTDDAQGNNQYHLDILNGQLRTRFFYAKFMLHRCYIFKALHFPEKMLEEDAAGCAIAIESACLWPLSMASPRDKKRLIPHLFTWTKNFVGILLILRMTVENECLRQICDRLKVDKSRIEQTVALLMDWVRDLRQLDSAAGWMCDILESLYGPK